MLRLRPIARPQISRFLIGFSERLAANGNCILRRDEYGVEAVDGLSDFAQIYAQWLSHGNADRLPSSADMESALRSKSDGLQKHLIDVHSGDPDRYAFVQFDPETRLAGEDLSGKLVRNYPDSVMAEAVLVDYSTAALLRRCSFMEISLGTGGVSRRFARLILPLGGPDSRRCTHLMTVVRLQECSTDRQVAPFHFQDRRRTRAEITAGEQANDAIVGLDPDIFDKLDDTALLEQFLIQIFPRIDPRATAARLITTFGNLAEVINADPQRLKDIGNLSYGSIAQLKAAGEMATRIIRRDLVDKPLLKTLDELLIYCRARVGHRSVEVVRALFVDNRLRLIHDEQISRGSNAFAPVESREIIKRALNLDASGIVLVHNHPSDDPTPSAADIQFSRDLKYAANSVDLELHDHLIVTRDSFSSLRQLGYLRRAPRAQ
ncbi:MAG: DNA repair protein RadC [Pseudomonadota bacterium]